MFSIGFRVIGSLALCGSLLLGCAAEEDGGEDSVGTDEGAVIGGAKVKPSQSKYALGILIKRADLSVVLCTGTLVDETWVVTAGHCLENAVAANVFTDNRVAEANPNATPDAYMLRYSIHPAYNPNVRQPAQADNDIAIFKLSNKPKGSKSARLPAEGAVQPQMNALVLGFGRTGALNPASTGVLYEGDLKIQKVFPLRFQSTGPDDTCYGDSGGPVMNKAETALLGVVSGGTRGKCASGQNTFSRVDAHLQWIRSVQQ